MLRSTPECNLAPPGRARARTCLDLGAQLGELGVGGAAVELVHDLRRCVGGWARPECADDTPIITIVTIVNRV